MISEFVLKLILSFVIGGIWVSLTTVVSERGGTKLGGLIGGLPSTIVVSLFFIGWTQGAAFAVESTNLMPAVLGVDMLFLVVAMLLLEYGLIAALTGAFASWFVLSVPFVILEAEFWPSFLVLAIGTSLALYILKKKTGSKSKSGMKIKYNPSELLFRAIFAGGVIAFAVIASSIGGSFWGGMFAVFPAVFTSTVVILSLRQGKEFTQAVGKMIIISTAVNVTLFIVVCRYAYLIYGIWIGTAMAYVASLISAMVVYEFAKKFMK